MPENFQQPKIVRLEMANMLTIPSGGTKIGIEYAQHIIIVWELRVGI